MTILDIRNLSETCNKVYKSWYHKIITFTLKKFVQRLTSWPFVQLNISKLMKYIQTSGPSWPKSRGVCSPTPNHTPYPEHTCPSYENISNDECSIGNGMRSGKPYYKHHGSMPGLENKSKVNLEHHDTEDK